MLHPGDPGNAEFHLHCPGDPRRYTLRGPFGPVEQAIQTLGGLFDPVDHSWQVSARSLQALRACGWNIDETPCWQVSATLVGKDGGFLHGPRRGRNFDIALQVSVEVRNPQGWRHTAITWIVSGDWEAVIHALRREGYDPHEDRLLTTFRGLAQEVGNWVAQHLAQIPVSDTTQVVHLLEDLELAPHVEGDTVRLVARA
jgi:hypothetical protein